MKEKSNRQSQPNKSLQRVRFERVAEDRVNFVLLTMDKLRRFAVKSNYKAEPSELQDIIKALRDKVDELDDIFKNGEKAVGGFTFSKKK